jgi:hypothetical protein
MKMAKLRTPARHVRQAHQIVTERNQQRVTDAVPETDAGPDRSDGDMRVGDVSDMARGDFTK